MDKTTNGTAPAEPVELTSGQIAQLCAFAGAEGEPNPDDQAVYVIQHCENGHAGPGLYAWLQEYPEEGAIKLDGVNPRWCVPIANHALASSDSFARDGGVAKRIEAVHSRESALEDMAFAAFMLEQDGRAETSARLRSILAVVAALFARLDNYARLLIDHGHTVDPTSYDSQLVGAFIRCGGLADLPADMRDALGRAGEAP